MKKNIADNNRNIHDNTNRNNIKNRNSGTYAHSTPNETKERRPQAPYSKNEHYNERVSLRAEGQKAEKAEEQKSEEQKAEERRIEAQRAEEQKAEEQKYEELRAEELKRAEEQRFEERKANEHALQEPSARAGHSDTKVPKTEYADKHYDRHSDKRSDFKSEEDRIEERASQDVFARTDDAAGTERADAERLKAYLGADNQTSYKSEEQRGENHSPQAPFAKADSPIVTEYADTNNNFGKQPEAKTEENDSQTSLATAEDATNAEYSLANTELPTEASETKSFEECSDKRVETKDKGHISQVPIPQTSSVSAGVSETNYSNKRLEANSEGKPKIEQPNMAKNIATPNHSKPASGTLSYHYLSDDLREVLEGVGRAAEEAAVNATNGDELKNGYDNAKNAATAPLSVVEAVAAQAMLTKYLHGDGKRAVREGNNDILYRAFGIDPVAKTSMDEMRIYARSTDLTELGLMGNKYDHVIKDRDKMQARLDQLNAKGKLKISEQQEVADLQKRITEINYDIDAITSGQAYNRKQYAKLIKKLYDVDVKEADLYTVTQSVVTLKTLKNDEYITVKDKNNYNAEYKIPIAELEVRPYAVSGQSFVAKNAEEACRFSDAEYAAKASFISAKQKISKVCNESWALRNSGINNMTPGQIKACEKKYTISLTSTDIKAGKSLEAKVLEAINSTPDDRSKALIMIFNGMNLVNGRLVTDPKIKEQAEALLLFKSSIERHFNNIDNGVYGAARGLLNNAEHSAQESDVLQGYKLSSKPAKAVRSGLRTKWFIQKNKHLVKRSLMEKKLKNNTFKNQRDKKLFEEKYNKLYGEAGKWTKKEKQHLIRQQRAQDMKTWAPRQVRKLVNKGLNGSKAVIMKDDGTDLLGIRKRYAKMRSATRKVAMDNTVSRTLRYGTKKGTQTAATATKKVVKKINSIDIPARKKAKEQAAQVIKKIGAKAGNLVKTVAANFMKYVGIAVMFLGLFTLLGVALIGLSRASFIGTVLKQEKEDLKDTFVNELDEYNKTAKKARNSGMNEIFSVFTDVYEPKRTAYDETYWLAQREPELRSEVDNFEANVWSNIASRCISDKVYSASSPRIENNGLSYYKITRDNSNASIISGMMSALYTLTMTQNNYNTPFNPFVFEKITLVDAEGDEESHLLAGYIREEVIDESIFTKNFEEIDENTSSDDIDAIIARELNKSMYFDTKFDANGHVTEEGIRVSDFSSNELMQKQIGKYVGLIKYCMKNKISELKNQSPTADVAKTMYDAILSNDFIKAGFNLSGYDASYFERNYVNYFDKYVICEHTGTWTDTGRTKEYTERSDADINAGRKYTVKIFTCDVCGEELEGEERTWAPCYHNKGLTGTNRTHKYSEEGVEYTVKVYICNVCKEEVDGDERTWINCPHSHKTKTGETRTHEENGRKYTVDIYICNLCKETVEGTERTWLQCQHEWQEIGTERLREHDNGGAHSGEEYTVKKYSCKKCGETKYGSERTWLGKGNGNDSQEDNSQHTQEEEKDTSPSTSKPVLRPKPSNPFKPLD